MPLQYEGILAEHRAVRTHAGIFDVSHMGNVEVPIDQAEGVARALAADVRNLEAGRARYTVLLREDGTILDDLIVNRLEDRFHIIPNAGQARPLVTRLTETGCTPLDLSRERCILAVQGPRARAIVRDVLGPDHDVGRFRIAPLAHDGLVTGTGYTGEPGVELVLSAPAAQDAYTRLTKAGIVPCGLGARDTLRLEMGYCLAGNEFEPPVTPDRAGLAWTVDDHDFVGREGLLEARAGPALDQLVGLRLTERGIPRRDQRVLAADEPVGRVSSGTLSPTLGVGIALAYVAPDHAAAGTALAVDVRGRPLAAVVERPPFVHKKT